MSLRFAAVFAAIPLLCSAANASVAEELTAAINKCAAIAEDDVRHACYDQLPALVKSLAPVAAVEARAPVAARPNAPPEEPADLLASQPVPADHVTARVENVTYNDGLFVVTLDNGQVWRQLGGTGDLNHFSRDQKDQVTIWRNMFGEYVLRIEGFHTTYRVRRVK